MRRGGHPNSSRHLTWTSQRVKPRQRASEWRGASHCTEFGQNPDELQGLKSRGSRVKSERLANLISDARAWRWLIRTLRSGAEAMGTITDGTKSNVSATE